MFLFTYTMVLLPTLCFCKKQPQKTARKLCVRFSTLMRKKIRNKIYKSIYIYIIRGYYTPEIPPGDEEVPKPQSAGGRQRALGRQRLPRWDTAPTARHGPGQALLRPLPPPTSPTTSKKLKRAKGKGYKEEALRLKRRARELEGFTNDTLVQRPTRTASGICFVTALRSPTSSGRRDIGPLPPVFRMAPTTGSAGRREAVPDELYGDRWLRRKPQGLPPSPREGPRLIHELKLKKLKNKSPRASMCLEKMMSASYSVDPIN